MKYKSVFGWTILIVLSLIPVFLLYFLGNGAEGFTNYASTTHTLGEIAGLVAMTMFALTFVLSTRIKFIENIFDGLDKVYIAHGILGGSALVLILFHPIFLVLGFIPSNVMQAAIYILPSAFWSVNFGIIALVGLIALIYLTLYTRKLKYNYWKFTHEFLGLVFLFAVLHIFLVPTNATQDNIFNGYYYYASVVSLVGLSAFSYSLFIKDRIFKAAVYRVASVQKKNENVYEINMIPEHKPINYKSGQFVFLRFYNSALGKEPHPFSVASKSGNQTLKVIVKVLGDYTSRLVHLKPGDKVSVEGPYGRFNYKRGDKDQIWLAGGIGITPFIGMVEDMPGSDLKNKVDLYYSVSTSGDFIGVDELKGFESDKFRLIPWVTAKNGYLKAEDIASMSGNLKDKEFYLCGPGSFKSAIISGLKQMGVSGHNIHTEEFDFK